MFIVRIHTHAYIISQSLTPTLVDLFALFMSDSLDLLASFLCLRFLFFVGGSVLLFCLRLFHIITFLKVPPYCIRETLHFHLAKVGFIP